MSEKIERTDENRQYTKDQVKRWRKTNPEAQLWNRYRQYLRFCARMEAEYPEEAKKQQIRVKLGGVTK